MIKAFNLHFMELCKDIQKVYPDNKDIQKVVFGAEMLQKTKPRLFIEYWSMFSVKYLNEINSGNIDFFIKHDYKEEIAYSQTSSADKIAEYMDKFRGPIHDMGDENKSKCMKYIQNLTKMCQLYISQNQNNNNNNNDTHHYQN